MKKKGLCVHALVQDTEFFSFIFNNFKIYFDNNRLPHTQGTQGIQGIFKLKKISGRLRASQGILIYFLNSGKLRENLIFSKKFRKVLKF